MQDAPGVRIRDGFRDFLEQFGRATRIGRAGANDLSQSLTLNVVHGEPWFPVVFAEFMQRDDVWVLKRCHGRRLGTESLAVLRSREFR